MRLPRALILLVPLAAACASAPKYKEVVWPPPPETPRIKFVTTFATEQDLENSSFKRFTQAVLGTENALRISQPMGIGISPDGERLYIADSRGGQVVIADLKNKKMSRFTPDQGSFSSPFNVVVDRQENLYVSDAGGKSVSCFRKTGERLWAVSGDLERPTGLALDEERKILYVADTSRVMYDTHRVFAYDLQGHRLRQVGGSRGSDPGEFNFPLYLAVDKAGNLYVSDTMNFRIQVFDKDGQFLRQYGEQGDSPGTFARMKGLAFDGFGNLYSVDGQNAVVQLFNPEFQPLMYFGGRTNALEFFDIPSCISIDPKINRIYVCNEQNARINVYDLINTRAADSFDPSLPPEGGAAPGGSIPAPASSPPPSSAAAARPSPPPVTAPASPASATGR